MISSGTLRHPGGEVEDWFSDMRGPRPAFLDGDQWAYTARIVAVLLGAALVWFKFPKRDDEQRLLAEYRAEDAAS